jgi:hypothetical protein
MMRRPALFQTRSTDPRRVRRLGVTAAGGLLLSALAVFAPVSTAAGDPSTSSSSGLPVDRMEQILQAKGEVTNGVLEIEMDRTDLSVKGGTPPVHFVDGFQIQHELFFQSIGSGKAIFNGDLALKPNEIQPVIDAILANGMSFQAEHQHLYDLDPMVWFIHFRGTGDPEALAEHVHNVVAKTAVPLPQSPPAHPSTPLPAQKLGEILSGDVSIGENGVVTVTVPRTDEIRLGGVEIKPELNVSTSVQFEPLDGGRAAVVPDFSMTANEINPVTATMRDLSWEDGCLYNQETAESPQLYFSHMFKVGDPETLAREVRKGLDHTAAQRSS